MTILVDSADAWLLEQFHWSNMKGYIGHSYKVNGRTKTEYLHRIVMQVVDKNIQIDHINNNPFDNRKVNLRLVSPVQNCAGRRGLSNSKSQYKGVSWRKDRQVWVSEIIFNGNRKYLGYFHSEIEAAKAYNIAALELQGEFAYLNEV